MVIKALAANADTTLTLFGSSMNVGDSLLTTIVSAELTAEAGLTINAVEPDTVVPTTGDSSYYSVPRAGDRNVFERWFTLRITKPDQASVTQVRVILRGAGDLQQIYEEAPGPNVQVVDNERIRVRVSRAAVTSTRSGASTPIARTSCAWWIMSASSAASSCSSCIRANEIPTSGTAHTIRLISKRR